MSRRYPTKSERQAIVTLDLLAEWREYADPLPVPRSEHDWRYYGTITINGQTGALAWRGGGYGMGLSASVRELGLWGRIKVSTIPEFERPPGVEFSPSFPPSCMANTGTWMRD